MRPRGPHRLGERGAPRAEALHLLAIARQDEQRVVDREPQPEPDREVEREDRQRRQLVDDPQAEKGRHDRQQADEQRQQRGDRAAEDHERQQEEQGEGEELSLCEVGRDEVSDLGPRDLQSAGRDVREGVHRLIDALRVLVARTVLEEDADEARASVTRDERAARGSAAKRARELRDGAVGPQHVDDPFELRLSGRSAYRPVAAHEHDDARAQRPAPDVDEPLGRDRVLRCLVDEVLIGLHGEQTGYRRAGADGDGKEDGRRYQDAARLLSDQAGDRCEHLAARLSDHSLTSQEEFQMLGTIPASATPACSASRPMPSTGPSAPLPCRPPAAAIIALQASISAVKS